MKFKMGISFVLCLVLYACTSSGRMNHGKTPAPERDTLDVIFDARADSQITVHQPKSDNIAMADTPIAVISEPQQPAEPLNLSKPIPEATKVVPGFRVQVMASSSQAAAVQYLDEAKQKLNQPGYVVPEGNLWKVQMGDFTKREDADAFKKVAQANGFSSAWIVVTKIKSVPEAPAVKTSVSTDPNVSKTTVNNTSDKYRIQIFAGTNKAGADDVAEKAKDLAGDEIYIVQEQGLWKVRVGDFQTKELAEKALTNWKNQGYNSAWIVEIK